MRVVRSLREDFGAEVEGIDLTAPLDTADTAGLVELLHRHSLLLLRAPGFEPRHQAALARALGRPKDETRKEFAVPGHPMVCRLGTEVGPDGRPTAFFNRQGVEWHSDGVGSGDTTGITMLYAVAVPRHGGDTMYASLHTAWETLDAATRAVIAGKRALHSFNWHNDKILRLSPGAAKPLRQAERDAIPDRWYDIVQTHPVTGRRLYYISPNLVREIPGLDEAARDGLVDRLVAHASQPAHVYRHRWTPGDLLVWDNNALMHSPTEADAYADDRRLMHRSFTVPPGGAIADRQTEGGKPMIDARDIETFRRDGVVCIRRAFDPDWIARVSAGIDKDLADLGPLHTIQQTPDAPGSFVTDFCLAQRIDELRDFVLDSPAGEIVGRLMGSAKCNFFYDALWAKGPGTAKRTRWHQDQPYYPIDGRQVAIMWLPVDPVARETSLECIRGSHLWNRWFQPELSRDAAPLYAGGARAYETLPDIDAARAEYDIVSYAMEPGDCLVFAGLTVHGAPGNLSDKRARRALSTVWMGDDATFGARPGKVRPFFEGHGLKPGDAMDVDYFPRVWPRGADSDAIGRGRFGPTSTFKASI